MFLLHNKLRCLNCCILCRLGYFFKTHGTITTIDVVRQKLSLPGEFTATNLAFLCFVQSVPLSWKKRLIYLLHLHLRSLIAVVSVLFSSCGDRWNQSTTLNGSQVEVESVIDVNSIFFFLLPVVPTLFSPTVPLHVKACKIGQRSKEIKWIKFTRPPPYDKCMNVHYSFL